MMKPRIDPEGRNITRPTVNFITINCGMKFSDKEKSIFLRTTKVVKFLKDVLYKFYQTSFMVYIIDLFSQ